MSKKVFINLPVQDLQKSLAFYTAIGFTNNPHFTDETAAGMMYSEEIYVMLLTHAKTKMFTPKAIANAKETTEVLNALSVDSRAEVDQFLEKALAHGGNEFRPGDDHGFMYGRAFEDLDGHIWEVFYMDQTQIPNQ